MKRKNWSIDFVRLAAAVACLMTFWTTNTCEGQIIGLKRVFDPNSALMPDIEVGGLGTWDWSAEAQNAAMSGPWRIHVNNFPQQGVRESMTDYIDTPGNDVAGGGAGVNFSFRPEDWCDQVQFPPAIENAFRSFLNSPDNRPGGQKQLISADTFGMLALPVEQPGSTLGPAAAITELSSGGGHNGAASFNVIDIDETDIPWKHYGIAELWANSYTYGQFTVQVDSPAEDQPLSKQLNVEFHLEVIADGDTELLNRINLEDRYPWLEIDDELGLGEGTLLRKRIGASVVMATLRQDGWHVEVSIRRGGTLYTYSELQPRDHLLVRETGFEFVAEGQNISLHEITHYEATAGGIWQPGYKDIGSGGHSMMDLFIVNHGAGTLVER